MPPFVHETGGRNPRTIAALALAWALILAAALLLDAALWIVLLFGLLTLPAIRDLWANPSAGLRLDDAGLSWHSGRRRASIALDEIGRVRLDRSWDFSMRVSVVLVTGRRIRLPAETTPPPEAFEAALAGRGIVAERHPFSLF